MSEKFTYTIARTNPKHANDTEYYPYLDRILFVSPAQVKKLCLYANKTICGDRNCENVWTVRRVTVEEINHE